MKSILAATGIGLVFVYVIGSGLWVNTGDNWYRNLNQPPWQPPDFIFGIIWPYNFIIPLSVIFALTWAFQFYRPHNLQAASIALALTALLTIPMVAIAFRTSIPMGFALLPYQAWVAIAANLSYTYSKLN